MVCWVLSRQIRWWPQFNFVREDKTNGYFFRYIVYHGMLLSQMFHNLEFSELNSGDY